MVRNSRWSTVSNCTMSKAHLVPDKMAKKWKYKVGVPNEITECFFLFFIFVSLSIFCLNDKCSFDQTGRSLYSGEVGSDAVSRL